MALAIKRKRVVLSLQQKLDIIKRLDQGETVASLAQEYNVGKSSVTDIKLRKNKILNYVSSFKSVDCIQQRKTMKSAYNKELDKAIHEWYLQMESNGQHMTSQSICNKALELNQNFDGSPDFKASASWLKNFKSRHGLDFTIQTDGNMSDFLADWNILSNHMNGNTPDHKTNLNYNAIKENEHIYKLESDQTLHINLNSNAIDRQSQLENSPKHMMDIQCIDVPTNAARTAKRKRVVLSLKQKIDIINRLKDGESESSLAKEYNIAYSSLKVIKTNQNIILDYVSSFDCPDNMNQRKTMKSAYNKDLDDAVYAWYKESQRMGHHGITGPQICNKALKLNKVFGGTSDFKASNGWLKNFKSRHGLVFGSGENSKSQSDQNFNTNSSSNETWMEFSAHYKDSVPSEFFPSCDVILTVPDENDRTEDKMSNQSGYNMPGIVQSFDAVIDWVHCQKECSSFDVFHLLKLRDLACKKAMAVAFSTDDSEAINRKINCKDGEKRHKSISLEDMYEMRRCVDWIKTNNFTKVALQFPDSMLCDATYVALKLGDLTEQQMFILGDTSYGSCCVDEIAAEHVLADAIIHFGHACLSPTKRLPVLYVFGKQIIDIQDAADSLKKLFPNPNHPVIILYEVMYSYAIGMILERIKEYTNLIISRLEIPGESGKDPDSPTSSDYFIEVTKCHRHISIPKSHDLNDYSVFYIGSRDVTLTNFMMSMKTCIFRSYNPLSRVAQTETLDVNKHLKRRYYYIEKAKDANIIGILVGTLGVLDYMVIIRHLKELIKKAGKKSYVLAVGKLNVAKLANFAEIDIFVNVACIESSLIESRDFYQSIITPFELEIALNEARSWTGDYIADFREILPGAAGHVPTLIKTEIEGDVSLVTGKMRYSGISADGDAPITSEGTLVSRNDMAISTVHAQGAGEYLTHRSWQGLEQCLGETPVSPIEQGQSGIACQYEDENKL